MKTEMFLRVGELSGDVGGWVLVVVEWNVNRKIVELGRGKGGARCEDH